MKHNKLEPSYAIIYVVIKIKMCMDCDIIAVVMDIVLSTMGYTFLSTAQNQVKSITGKILSIIGRALY